MGYNPCIPNHPFERSIRQVIFLQDVPQQAHASEIKRVADGYARNYLIPKGLAKAATPEVLKRSNKIKAAGDQQRIQETDLMEELAQLLDNTVITMKARVTPTGRYYGAISSARVAEELSSAIGRNIERHLVDVVEPIREPGEYEFILRLSTEIQATIQILAEAEE